MFLLPLRTCVMWARLVPSFSARSALESPLSAMAWASASETHNTSLSCSYSLRASGVWSCLSFHPALPSSLREVPLAVVLGTFDLLPLVLVRLLPEGEQQDDGPASAKDAGDSDVHLSALGGAQGIQEITGRARPVRELETLDGEPTTGELRASRHPRDLLSKLT
jgi:hypothetical protein